MSAYLIKVEEMYRADTEQEASQIIQNAKKDEHFILSRYDSVKKERKQKGEIIDEWFRVRLTKEFTSEKEPTEQINIKYELDNEQEEMENE